MNLEDSNITRGYEIPENYFESLQEKVMQRIAQEDIQAKRKKRITKIIKFLLPAAAAAIAIGMFFTAKLDNKSLQSPYKYESFDIELSSLSNWSTFDLLYNQTETTTISANEIEDFLQYATIDHFMLMENF